LFFRLPAYCKTVVSGGASDFKRMKFLELINKSVAQHLKVVELLYLFVLVIVIGEDIIASKIETMKSKNFVFKCQPNSIAKKVRLVVEELNLLAIL
jgi:hypothetical protein